MAHQSLSELGFADQEKAPSLCQASKTEADAHERQKQGFVAGSLR